MSDKQHESPSKSQKTNRNILKAIVLGNDGHSKNNSESESQTLPNDPFSSSYGNGLIIEPPYDLLFLTMLEENSAFLRQIIDAMEVNIEGFGGRLHLREMTPDQIEKNKDKIEDEKKQLKAFLLNINPEDDITMLRRKVRRDRELTGTSYWEAIPSRGDHKKIVALNYVESHTIRLTKLDDELTPFTRSQVDPDTGEFIAQTFLKRFRRFVQIRNVKQTFFKEWGDPRIIDRRDGKAYANEEEAIKSKVERQYWANPMVQFNIHSARTPYGMPRYVGNLFSLFGSRAADEINYNTFINHNIPSMLFLISGNAMLTEGTIKRMEDYASSLTKRTNNRSKFLVIEAEPVSEGMQNSGTAKIDVKPLKSEQHNDMLFQVYDSNNSEKLRQAFRLPPIFVGKSDDFNRATADASRKLAEEQIFAPERREMDRRITQLFLDMGYQFWTYKSFSPNVTNDEDLVNLLSSVEKTGAMTPNIARKIVADIMNEETELYDEENTPFNPDIPFSLTMAEAVKGSGSLGGNGNSGVLAPNQGQIPISQQGDFNYNFVPEEIKQIKNFPEPSIRQIELLKEWEEKLNAFAEGNLNNL
jgi:PBSX family phage portal protein